DYQSLEFLDPNRVQFTYDLVFLGQLNQPPYITSVPVVDAIVGRTYSYAATATDAESNPLTFSLTTAPSAMQVDPTLGQVTWSPTTADLGTHNITLRVDDGLGGYATQSYVINVTTPPPNRPPYFTSEPVVDANVNLTYAYQAMAFDPDGNPLTFAVATGPAGVQIDSHSGLVSWTPTSQQLGPQNVSLTVVDGQGGTATQSYTILVQPESGDQPPVIISQPVTGVGPGQEYLYPVQALDPDGNPLTYTLTQYPEGMTIDAASGLIQWQQPADTLSKNQVTFSDGTFTPSGWDTFAYHSGNPNTSGTATTVSSGGDPGSYRLLSSDVWTSPDVEGASDVYTFSKQSIYTPAVSGGILSIDFSCDVINNPAGPALIQNGKLYVGPLTILPTSGKWTSIAASGLDAEDFALVDPTNTGLQDSTQHPDFSPNGGPIELGFWWGGRQVLQPSRGPFTYSVGVDNWTCTVTPIPNEAVSVQVQDGRGGIATQQFTISVTPPASIQGFVYDDLNSNGVWDSGPDLI